MPHSRTAKMLVCILLGSLLLKIFLILLLWDLEPFWDERDYVKIGRGLASGLGFYGQSRRPPVYPAFLGFFFLLFGSSLVPPRIGQALASIVSALLVFRIGKVTFGRSCGLAAAAIFSFFPTLVAYTHFLWNETLFILFLLSAYYFLLLYHKRGKSGHLIFAGVSLGLGSLVKSQTFFLCLLLAVFLFLKERRIRKRFFAAGLLLLFTLATILPWTIRNALRFKEFLLIDTVGGKTLWWDHNYFQPICFDFTYNGIIEGIIRQDEDLGKTRPKSTDPNPSVKYREDMRNAVLFTLEEPGLFLRRIPFKLGGLWNPSSHVIRHLRLGLYGEPGRKTALVLTLPIILSYCAVIFLSLAGLFFSKNDFLKKIFLILLGFFSLLFCFCAGMSRHRLPLMPFLILYAAYALIHLGSIRAAFFRRRRVIPLLALFALLVYAWIPHISFLLQIKPLEEILAERGVKDPDKKLASFYIPKGLFEKALVHMERVRQEGPDKRWILNELYFLVMTAKDRNKPVPQKAILLLEEEAGKWKGPGKAECLGILSQAYSLNGEREKAIETVKKALKLNPLKPEMLKEWLKFYEGNEPSHVPPTLFDGEM